MPIDPDCDQALDARPPRVSSIVRRVRPKPVSVSPAPVEQADLDTRLEFLELALHDLQTPVAILDVSLTLLAGDLSPVNGEALATLRDAERAVRRIQQHIDHLVTSQRLFSGQMRPDRHRLDVARLLRDLVADYADHARALDVTLDLDLGRTSLVLDADHVLLSRIFQNLLENGLRHVERGGRLLLRARGGSVIEVQVCNDGAPVPDSERERIFQKHCGVARTNGMSGLGLYFCRLAAQAHGGTIILQDDPRWPICFVVRLPIATIDRREEAE
ncbi:MAG TPA: HAMP domain-containing sensor histidine kinase [Polyangiaceae bacterium]